jgi:hypothetical protein
VIVFSDEIHFDLVWTEEHQVFQTLDPTFPEFTLTATSPSKTFNLAGLQQSNIFVPNELLRKSFLCEIGMTGYDEPNIFRQEGWHYHIEDKEDPITYNGVVYNEMKGAFSSADEYLERVIFNALFPDTAYSVESGGDPECIPDLTYEQFLAFHARYYHPSNSYIYLYGDMNMAETLDFIDRNYLSEYDAITVNSEIMRQTPFEEMITLRDEYPISDEDEETENTYLAWNVVTGDPGNIKEMIAFDDIDYKEDTLQLEHGDTLVMFTDGVTEAMNGAEQEFGTERLDNILSGLASNSSQQIVEAVKAGVRDFVDGAEQSDDITMLVLKRK